MVGVPRFELGSKRPKRPSIGQTNPYARSSWPQLHTYEVHSRNCHISESIRIIKPWDSISSMRESTSMLQPFSISFF